MAVKCPKCDALSNNEETCDTCGALLARLRARQAEEAVVPKYGPPSLSPAHFHVREAGGPKLTKLLLIALLVGVLGMWLMSMKGSSGAALEQVLETAQMEPPPMRRTGSVLLGTARMEPVVSGPARVTVVNFWAPWCGPCKMYEPTLLEVADEFGGDLKLVKLNLDDNETPAKVAKVRAVPSILVYDELGEMQAHFTGGPSPERLRKAIQAAMK